MKQRNYLRFSSAIVLYGLFTFNPALAQNEPGQFVPLRSAVNSTVRSHKPIPAWLGISSRWMFVDISELMALTCSGHRGQNDSQFIISGRGGLPPTPAEATRSDTALVDLGKPVQGEENRPRARILSNPTTAESAPPLVEASRWVIGEKGEVILTAAPTTPATDIPWLTHTSCHGS